MMANCQSDETCRHFGADLSLFDPDTHLPSRDTLDFVIRLTSLGDTIFEYNSVDCCAAHRKYADQDNPAECLA